MVESAELGVPLINSAPPGVFSYPRPPGGSDSLLLSRTPPAISKTVGRSETDEVAFERTRRFVPGDNFRF